MRWKVSRGRSSVRIHGASPSGSICWRHRALQAPWMSLSSPVMPGMASGAR
jgi:hypothetical protein